MKVLHAATLAASALLVAAPVAAQYVGPSNVQPLPAVKYHSVAEIVKKPVDDVIVELQGKLLRQVGKEKYIFSDGTDEIRVEIDDELLAGKRIDADTTVRIRGEVEKDFLQSPEIDVDQLTIVTATGSTAH